MKRIKKNILSAIIAQIVTIITGFLVQRYLLITYGSSYNGLTSSINQILQYLVLIEAGITTASIQALYKPIIEKDNSTINGILSATRLKFIRIGLIFLIVLLITSFILPLIIGDEISYWVVFTITIASGISTGFTYIFINKYQALFYADNKTGIVYNVTSGANIFICVIKILFMQIGLSIIYVQLATLFGVIVKLAYMHHIVYYDYKKISFETFPRYDLIKKSNNVLVHQIAGFINNNIDVLLITIFSTLKNVSLYSVYSMIFGHISSLLQNIFAQAPLGYLGQYYARDKEKFKEIFDAFEISYTYITFVILTSTMAVILPFIKLYTIGINDITYINFTLAMLFFLSQLLNLIRIPSIVTINISGNFKETQKGAIIESIINLIVSLFLFFYIGIYGLLIGTIVAMIFRSIDITYYVYHNILEKKIRTFFYKVCIHLIVSIICISFIYSLMLEYITNWFKWICCSSLVVVIISIIYLVIEVFLFRKEVCALIFLIKYKKR